MTISDEGLGDSLILAGLVQRVMEGRIVNPEVLLPLLIRFCDELQVQYDVWAKEGAATYMSPTVVARLLRGWHFAGDALGEFAAAIAASASQDETER